MKTKDNNLRRNLRDILFQEEFAKEENLPSIYHSLFPDDKNWQERHYEFLGTSILVTNTIVNYMSFLVDNRIVCLEATSTWKKNDLLQFAAYATYITDYCWINYENFNMAKVSQNLFVLYTGTESNPKKEYNCVKDTENDLADGHTILDIDATVLSKGNNNIPDIPIFKEYLDFCEIFENVVEKYGRTREAVKILIEECISKGIYREFFEKRREETMDDYYTLLTQERYYTQLDQKISQQQKVIDQQKKKLADLEKTLKLYIDKYGPLD